MITLKKMEPWKQNRSQEINTQAYKNLVQNKDKAMTDYSINDTINLDSHLGKNNCIYTPYLSLINIAIYQYLNVKMNTR